jgi:hypothetical protein
VAALQDKTLHEHFNRAKAPTAHLSEVSDDTPVIVDTLAEVEDSEPLSVYLVRFPICLVALLTLPSPDGTSLSQCWVVGSACCINLSAHRCDFVTFTTAIETPLLEELVLSYGAVAVFVFTSNYSPGYYHTYHAHLVYS